MLASWECGQWLWCATHYCPIHFSLGIIMYGISDLREPVKSTEGWVLDMEQLDGSSNPSLVTKLVWYLSRSVKRTWQCRFQNKRGGRKVFKAIKNNIFANTYWGVFIMSIATPQEFPMNDTVSSDLQWKMQGESEGKLQVWWGKNSHFLHSWRLSEYVIITKNILA